MVCQATVLQFVSTTDVASHFFIFSVNFDNVSTLKAYLPFNPLMAVLAVQFRFMNFSICVSVAIVSVWLTYLDFAFTYHQKGVFLENSYQVLVANGRNFRALNGLLLGWPPDQTLLRHLPTEYLALGKRIWQASGDFTCPTSGSSFSTPALRFSPLFLSVNFSATLRSRLYVCSTAFEIFVVFINVLIRKF